VEQEAVISNCWQRYNQKMITNKDKIRERFLSDPLPLRLGGPAATLGRISSVARKSSDPENVTRLLIEAKYLIERTAADAEPEVAAELVSIQTLILCVPVQEYFS
jgi:hypothetical protein